MANGICYPGPPCPPFTHLDLVTCRNVLIYLDREAIQRVLFMLHSALRVGGYLSLGKGEPLSPRLAGFKAVSTRWHIYRNESPAAEMPFKFPPPKRDRRSVAVPASAHRTAVEHLNLPSVLIDVRRARDASFDLHLSKPVDLGRLLRDLGAVE